MSRSVSVLLLIIITFTTIFASENYKQVKVFVDSNQFKEIADLGIALDHIQKAEDGGLVLFVSDTEFEQLKSLNLHLEILINDWNQHYSERKKLSEQEKINQLNQTAVKFGVKDFEFGSMGGYYTLSEVNLKIQELLDNYPNVIGGAEVIGQSIEGRDLIAFKLSDNPDVDEDEPEVLYTALHHAREPEGIMQMFYFIQYLLDNYETNDEVKYLVDNRELYFIPVVNPDGYFYNETIAPEGGGGWRKNRRDNDDGTHGIDLNRNYGPVEYWDAPNGGSSTNTSSETFRGETPFSEPETDAIRNFLNNRNIRACLNYHTYSNLLIFPYGALDTETADSNTFREFAVDMTFENNYSVGTDLQTVEYSTRGNSDDYMYDGEPGRDNIFAMTPEVGNFRDGFWPAQNRIIPLAEENVFPNLYYANIAGGYPSVVDLVLDKEFVLPGDEFTLTPVVKNKGLGDSGEFEVKIFSLNEAASVTTDNAIIIENLEARSIVQAETGFGIDVAENTNNETDLVFQFDILQNGLIRKSDTLKVKLGQPIVLFADDVDENTLETHWISQGSFKKWEKTSSHSYNGKYSYTDSKSGSYLSSTNTTLTLLNEIDLSGLTNAYLNFYTRYHIEAAFDAGFIEVSSDGGASWNVVGGNLAKPADSLFFHSNNVYHGEPIYTSALFEWRQEEIDLTDYLGQSILIRFTFYSDSGVEIDGWYLDDIQIVSYDISTGIVDEEVKYQFALEQNYPNPFNPSTKIEYQIAEEGVVSLKIYDVLGREMKSLVYEFKSPGNYSVDFDAKSRLSSGIYFYRLESGSFSTVRKMLLLK